MEVERVPPAVSKPTKATTSTPLDGLLLDITGWTADEIQTGVALMTELGQFGAGCEFCFCCGRGISLTWDAAGR
ncbi:hypothetical protein [Streptomyces griseocarneus]|uniref:hypothetical protein n=1 Tax=Streptomyces griseocarneus TaxID=51201 RepID=UPI001CCF1861|nr:hypothetical protein [Streptomyces griseocarneus]MBZ6478120.1 hypothetical protein [Streptomyces griseocarneus]